MDITTNTAQEAILGIFRELLHNAKIGADDDFFASGGTSSLAPELLVLISNALSVSLSVRDIYTYPSPAELAAELMERARSGGDKRG